MRHPLLPPSHQDEQALNPWTMLLRPTQIHPEYGWDTATFVSAISDEVIKWWHLEFLKVRVRNWRILGLSHEVRKEEEGTRFPFARMINPAKKAVCSSLTFLADKRTSKKNVFQVWYLSEDNLRGSKGGLDKHLRMREWFQSRSRISQGRHDLLKWWNICEQLS